jgi:hypothetical protein
MKDFTDAYAIGRCPTPLPRFHANAFRAATLLRHDSGLSMAIIVSNRPEKTSFAFTDCKIRPIPNTNSDFNRTPIPVMSERSFRFSPNFFSLSGISVRAKSEILLPSAAHATLPLHHVDGRADEKEREEGQPLSC